jgi:zinc D-Ala-D-Ala carboxypeptidase
MQLTNNFTLAELCKSQTALRKGIDNLPKDPDTVAKMQTLAEEILQPVRDKFGPTVINSGYRCKKLNTAIGGSKKSQHCFGEAADIEVPTISNRDLAEWIKNNLDFDQLILEFYNGKDPSSGWVHVSYKNKDDNRKQVLTINKQGTFQGLI